MALENEGFPVRINREAKQSSAAIFGQEIRFDLVEKRLILCRERSVHIVKYLSDPVSRWSCRARVKLTDALGAGVG